jgi:hypothetical protein
MLVCSSFKRWAEPADLVVAKVSSDEKEIDAPRESPDEPATTTREEGGSACGMHASRHRA